LLNCAQVQSIAFRFNVHKRTVYRWLHAWYEHGLLARPKGGRHRKMSAEAQRVMCSEMDAEPTLLWDGESAAAAAA